MVFVDYPFINVASMVLVDYPFKNVEARTLSSLKSVPEYILLLELLYRIFRVDTDLAFCICFS